MPEKQLHIAAQQPARGLDSERIRGRGSIECICECLRKHRQNQDESWGFREDVQDSAWAEASKTEPWQQTWQFLEHFCTHHSCFSSLRKKLHIFRINQELCGVCRWMSRHEGAAVQGGEGVGLEGERERVVDKQTITP